MRQRRRHFSCGCEPHGLPQFVGGPLPFVYRDTEEESGNDQRHQQRLEFENA